MLCAFPQARRVIAARLARGLTRRVSGPHCACGDEQLVVGVVSQKLVRRQILDGESIEKGACGQDVAEGFDSYLFRPEVLAQEPLRRAAGEAPVIPPAIHIEAADLADGG